MKQGESQRIYWQQWLGTNYSRRDLITSSAAIRINPDAAKAKDVTKLLRDTLKLSSLQQPSNHKKHRDHDHNGDHNDDDDDNDNVNHVKEELEEEEEQDSLVLVGTLYSLPKDYIQFEHEMPTEFSDPFHLIKTLRPNDNPLAIRDRMMEQLKRLQDQAPSSTSTISPKIQWYFVPRQGTSPIPSCIELDGYCTTLEEEDDDDENKDDDDDDDDGDDDTHDKQRNHYNQQHEPQSPQTTGSHHDETDTLDRDTYYDWDLLLSRCAFLEKPKLSKPQPKQKQLRRYFQLCQVEPCCSGYLLKQSRTDPHVWRKVHCVLTDDYLWYATRVPYHSSERPRMAKSHGKIALSRALLLEPNNTEYTASPLFRVPDAFELVNARGISHLFRASSRTLQQQWMQAITTKIMESFENSLLDQAELIVEEESMARNRRFTTMAVEPITPPSDNNSLYLSLIQANVLRLGMDICEYRELCRHVQASLPAKQPIVVTTSFSSGGGGGSTTGSTGSLDKATPSPRSSSTRESSPQIQLAWDRAASLLDKATHVALEVQQYVLHQTKRPISLSQSLETHCRHIDYVLTGKHRPIGSPTFEMERQSPPPMDLFDLLLSELQSLVNK